ncbi:SDR family NAD(P)-dependent oxidoreductase [Williamsia muralis]|uniref:Short-chain dehydrogenase n=1 Tax=Williamsia marianensis TaxID=85044 RepID=A0A2G3PGC6_WILMA|nr:SDR family oxidoreductase [Williamsia marianensis]PHV64859.1 short-chain dehydrogenase [Williamsia marianensis]
MELTGKTVLITGAARGLGEAFAIELAKDGAEVFLADVGSAVTEVAARIESNGGRAEAMVGSIVEYAFCDDVVAACVSRFGKVDAVVNNAGLIHEAYFWEDDPEAMRAIVEVNVLGTMNMGRATGAYMKDHGGGVILNVSSDGGGGMPQYSAYAASKGAISSLTYSWALDGDDHDIRVNAIAPFARTHMSLLTPSLAPNPPDPALIAPLVTYLVSDRSEGISGQVFRFTSTELGLLQHPRLKEPTLKKDRWNTADIREAIDGELSEHLEIVSSLGWRPSRMRDSGRVAEQ